MLGTRTLVGTHVHAGEQDLIRFVAREPRRSREIRLTHSDPEAKTALARMLCTLGLSVTIP
ncbi:MAG: MBL fold metallo-hydrolase RNA specificity domain-containing protein [Chromatiaceae bacterium]